MYYVYIVRTNDDRLYIGHTRNLDRRLIEHARGKFGAKFLKDHGKGFHMIHSEVFESRTAANEKRTPVEALEQSEEGSTCSRRDGDANEALRKRAPL